MRPLWLLMVLPALTDTVEGEPQVFQDTVLELRWQLPRGHTRPFVVLAGRGPGTLQVDPRADPALAAVSEGDRVQVADTEDGWRLLARDRSPVGCQLPIVGEGDGLSVVRLAPLAPPSGDGLQPELLGDHLVMQRPGIQVPGCPPEGARLAFPLNPGQRTWVRWVDGAWVRVPEH